MISVSTVVLYMYILDSPVLSLFKGELRNGILFAWLKYVTLVNKYTPLRLLTKLASLCSFLNFSFRKWLVY